MYVSLKNVYLRFFAFLVLSRNTFKVLSLQALVPYNMGTFLIPLLLSNYICPLSLLATISIRHLSFPSIPLNDK
jgi:hypothetical protein